MDSVAGCVPKMWLPSRQLLACCNLESYLALSLSLFLPLRVLVPFQFLTSPTTITLSLTLSLLASDLSLLHLYIRTYIGPPHLLLTKHKGDVGPLTT